MKKQLDIKKLVLLNLPYLLMGLFATNLGEGWRMATGADASAKMLSFFSTLPVALASWWPSLHPLDLLVGVCCGAGLRLAVYLKSKNAKKYRHGMEYGSARWGTHEDITPYIDPVPQNNVILTKTESLTMNSRPKDPKTARNKNVLVIGGSGSGKTRFWLKPNLMQMHSSYVVTDPKGTILVECGKMLQRGAPKLDKDGKPVKDKRGKVIYEPYRIKVLNTINFKKSMHYNPFAYIHDVDTWMIFKWVFKSAVAIIIVSNTWNIVMGVFDMAQSVVAQAAGIIGSDASIDISSVMTDMESRLMDMELGPLFGLWFQSLFIGITMWALYICIFIVIYGRMIEIYLVTSVAPIPMATMMSREVGGGMGQNYLRSLIALGFQAFLIIVCVAIYAVLVQNIATESDVIMAIWSCVGYTVLLCFTLFKTGSLSKSVFNAH